MGLLRRGYGDDDQQYVPSESTKYIKIHYAIILSVLLFIIIIGVLLYIYRRKLQKIKSLANNLNRSAHITHLTNADEGIYNSLDYYSNNFAGNDNKSSTYPSDKKINPQLDPAHENENENEKENENENVNENENELKSSGSLDSSISNGNRNYFIYAKSGKIKNDISSLLQFDKSDSKKSNSFSGSIKRSKKKSKVNLNQISPPITSSSDSIYDNEKAVTLANATTRVIPPVPSLPSNKYIQPKEILRGPQMTENHLIRQDSDTSDNTITTVTSGASDTSDDTITINTSTYDNPILEMTKKSDLEMTKIDLEMTKEDINNKIIINETKEVTLDMVPINENDNESNLKDSYSNLSRETNIFTKYYYVVS